MIFRFIRKAASYYHTLVEGTFLWGYRFVSQQTSAILSMYRRVELDVSICLSVRVSVRMSVSPLRCPFFCPFACP